MVYVTHDQTEAMTLADRIVVFNEGRIEQIGAPVELYDGPANLFVAGFIGAPAMNFIPAEIETAQGGHTRVRFGPVSLPLEREATPGRVTFGVRPEHLSVAAKSEHDFRGRVEIVEKLGAESLIYLQTDFSNAPVTMRMAPELDIHAGEEIPVRVGRSRFHLFDATGSVLRTR